MRVTQRGKDLGFALEAGDPIGIAGERFQQDPDRHYRTVASVGTCFATGSSFPAV